MTKDSRSERTEEKLRCAYLDLMRQMSHESIRVVDIAKLAGVSRKTFYVHYTDINDLAFDCFRTHLTLEPTFRIAQCGGTEGIATYVIDAWARVFTFCKDNVAFAKMIYEGALYSRYLSCIAAESMVPMVQSIEDIQPKESEVRQRLFPHVETIARVYFLGTGLIVSEWLKEGMKEPIELVARKAAYLTFHLSDIYSADTGACSELKRIVLHTLPSGESA